MHSIDPMQYGMQHFFEICAIKIGNAPKYLARCDFSNAYCAAVDAALLSTGSRCLVIRSTIVSVKIATDSTFPVSEPTSRTKTN